MIPSQYWSGSPGKSRGHQASIQCWATIGHLKDVSVAEDDPLSVEVFGSTLPLKMLSELHWTPLTKLSGSAHKLFMEKTSSSDFTPLASPFTFITWNFSS